MLKIIAVVVSLLAALPAAGPSAADTVHDDRAYSNQTPYGDPAKTSIRKPPAKYKQVFLETVGRHGSRSQTNNDSEQRALAVWNAASQKGQLTKIGKQFAADVRKFQAAEKAIGYGKLSGIGFNEWTGIGRRTAANYRSFLTSSATARDDIEFETTVVERTKQSASALRNGLSTAIPGLDLKAQKVDDRLRFSGGSTRTGKKAIDSVRNRSDVKGAARHVLRQIYSASYVDSLSNPVSSALDIYGMYAIAAGMQNNTAVTFSRYVPLADARLLGYAKDADNFYKYGPGVKGETSSYEKAKPLLKDFFARLDERLAGGDTAAVFRLAHGETTMPFAAVSKLSGASKPAEAGTPFSYANNPWRGYIVGRMAGNIEWAAYRNSRGTVVVTIRQNEQPVKLDSSCKSASFDPYFYNLTILKACLL